VSTQTGVTCTGTSPSTGCLTSNATGYITGGQPLTISGTSMASPHMAGTMALLRQLHPDWSAEELKALAMNTATHDVTIGGSGGGLKLSPVRVGAGRVDIPAAAASSVVAFNGEYAGLVSVTFENHEVVGASTQQKNIRLVNKGSSTGQERTPSLLPVILMGFYPQET
jgi:subtilisin family serine protease